MSWLRDHRIRVAECRLAKHKGELEALEKVTAGADAIPGMVVTQLRALSGMISETEQHLKHLKMVEYR
jgi:hypothetical protein